MRRPHLHGHWRMRRDLAVLWVRRNWAYAAGGLATLAGFAAFVLPNSVAFAIGLLTGLVSALVWWRERSQRREESHDVDFSLVGESTWDGIRVPPGQQVVALGGDHMVVDPAVDLALVRGCDRPLSVDPRRHELPSELQDLLLPAIRHTRRQGRLVFNGTVIRMDDDIDEDSLTTGSVCVVRPTSWFTTVATNYLARYDVVTRRTRRTLLHGPDLVYSARGLRPLSVNWSANPIGVSTLLLSKEGELIITHQTQTNQSSPHRLGPSGSGSVDDRDIAESGVSLAGLISTAVERELREECGLGTDVALRTRLVGYARWLEHGGKPEFFLLTKCDLSSDDIRRLRRTRDEDDLVGFVIAESLDADRLRLDPENPRLALPVTLRGSPSVPLLAALRAVGHGLATDPTLISG